MTTLFMLYLPLRQRELAAFAAGQNLGHDLTHGDSGYVLHALLSALFGQAPQPFSTRPAKGGGLDVLAYSAQPLAVLKQTADLTAEPQVLNVVDWERAADKPMPLDHFHAGQRLGFSVRVCPVVQVGRGATKKAAGSEVDAYLADRDHRNKDEQGPSREEVYADWFRHRLSGVSIDALHLETWLLSSLHRRPQATAAGGPRGAIKGRHRPDAVFTGTLTITDPAQFKEKLAHGIGRHKAFGFGMLLLRPVTPVQEEEA